jgi:hypothetical protein
MGFSESRHINLFHTAEYAMFVMNDRTACVLNYRN